MNANLSPIAPGQFFVIDRWVGLAPRTIVSIFATAAEAGREVADSLQTMEMFDAMEPIEIDLDHDCTWLEAVEVGRS